jgi:glutaminyl-tRNA synthetase
LRRRGFTPTAINRFAEDLGITTAYTIVDVRKLESYVRDDLNKITHRRMAVLEPLLVELTNVPASQEESILIPNDPRDLAKGEDAVPFTRQVFIEHADFRMEPADSNYFRLAPDQPVGLYKVGVITFTGVEKNEDGKIVKVLATLDRSECAPKPKTWIQWVSADSSKTIKAEIRLYSALFKSANPDGAIGGYLADIDPDSLTIVKDARVDARLASAKPEDKFQFQRVGYFCMDKDSKPSCPVFNLTVSIKEDPNKN